jgi:hypothetical protein
LNYLSHFYFDQSTNRPEFALGLILPDLVHSHNKNWVIKPEKNLLLYEGSEKDIYLGWQKHKLIDKIFHGSEFFKLKTAIIKDSIQIAFSQSPVWSFFLAHITLELSLDSLLISEGKIGVESFYSILEKVDRKTLMKFFVLNKVQEPGSFLFYLDEFLSSGYLSRYEIAAELTYPLDRICYKIWKERFTADQNICLRETILNFCYQNKVDFMEIFQFIESQLLKS